MSRKQLGVLAVLNASSYLIGNAVLPLLPLYFGELGARVVDSGLYLSLIFAALMAGALVGGWLSSRTNQRKRVLIVADVASLVTLLWLTQVTSLPLLLVLTMILWFAGGLTTTSVNILAGLHAPVSQRGRVFGAIGVTVGLSQFAGGLIAGPVVSRWGFQGLFMLLAVLQIGPILAALLVDDSIKAPQPKPSTSGRRSTSDGYWTLLGAVFLVYVINFAVVLGRPLAMQAAGLDAAAISSVVAVAGLVAIPLPFVMGWLSDRMGRKVLLALAWAGYVFAGVRPHARYLLAVGGADVGHDEHTQPVVGAGGGSGAAQHPFERAIAVERDTLAGRDCRLGSGRGGDRGGGFAGNLSNGRCAARYLGGDGAGAATAAGRQPGYPRNGEREPTLGVGPAYGSMMFSIRQRSSRSRMSSTTSSSLRSPPAPLG